MSPAHEALQRYGLLVVEKPMRVRATNERMASHDPQAIGSYSLLQPQG